LLKIMQRATARLLLLFALAGNLIPLALAAVAVPPHACCIRKNHHCHNSAATMSSQAEFHSRDCCRQNCGHAVVTAQWAHPEAQTNSVGARILARPVALHRSAPFTTEFVAQKATRAPPSLTQI
jgi:hypothetical protein